MVMCFAAREHNFTGRFQYASVLLAFNENLGSAGSSMEPYETVGWVEHHLSDPFRIAHRSEIQERKRERERARERERSEIQRNYAPGQPEENIVKVGCAMEPLLHSTSLQFAAR